MPRLLIVHHSPSRSTAALTNAVIEGAHDPAIEGVDVVAMAALEAGVSDVTAADGIVLGTPANLGYMSGALKHFFDTIYNDCLGETVSMPYGLYVHGNTDTSGAIASVQPIVTGLQWKPIAEPVSSLGEIGATELDEAWNLGAVAAALLVAS